MSNALVSMRFQADVPEQVVEAIVGREDDGTDEWFAEAMTKLEAAAKDDPQRFMEYVFNDPDVDVDA